MDIKAVNEEYLKLKSELKKTRKEVEKLEEDTNTLVEDRTIWNGKYVEAKRNKDTNSEKTAADEMDRIDKELKSVKENAEKKKDDLTKIQEKINERIKELKENSEMKKYLDEVMAKKYDRQINKIEKEKKEVVDKKGRLSELKQLVTAHPVLENHLKAYMREVNEAKAEIKKLQSEYLDKKNPPTSTRRDEIVNKLIPAEKAKIADNKHKDELMNYITKYSLNIKEQDIVDLASNRFVEVGKDGAKRIDLDATINREMKALDRRIKGYDKSIQNYQIAINDKGIEKSIKANTESKTDIAKDGEVKTADTTEVKSEEKPKWYQFIKRFKNWNEKRKRKALPKTTEKKEEEPVADAKTENRKNEFANSLKYEIVQDIVKQTQTNDLKVAKKERKTEEPEQE